MVGSLVRNHNNHRFRSSNSAIPTTTFNMKVIIVLVAVVAAAVAMPQGDAVITRLENDNIGLGNYNYAYETSHGISHQEQGQLKNAGTDNEAIEVRGQYTWVAPDGQQYAIQYIADENGFRPQGAHIPKK